MEPAVEIGKLRLWLSLVAELQAEDVERLDTDELALPNITFNVRQGNSLIGYVGFPRRPKTASQRSSAGARTASARAMRT